MLAKAPLNLLHFLQALKQDRLKAPGQGRLQKNSTESTDKCIALIISLVEASS